MSYTIRARVNQKDPAKWFSIGEKTVLTNGTWAECDGEHTLSMGDNGTSGTLRFKNAQGEYFLVALGIHSYQHWCDIVTDLNSTNSGVQIHPKFYGSGEYNTPPFTWTYAEEQHKTSSKGTTVAIKYSHQGGNNFIATISIT